jgi:Ca-activated chloride channel family protein
VRLSLIMSLLLLPSVAPHIPSSHILSYRMIAAQSSPQKPTQNPPKDTKNPPQDQDEAIRLTSRLVAVPLSASDASGKPVRDLSVQDFVIEESGRPQTIVSLGEPGKVPTEIALLFDVSGSVQGQFTFEQQAAVRFIKQVLKPGDAVSVFSIGTKPKLIKTRTTNGDEATGGLMSIVPVNEPTAFFDTVVEAALYVGKTADPGSRRVLVVISDGEENYSTQYKLADAMRELQKNDCLFYSINPSGSALSLNQMSVKGQGFMESMSAQTGGKAFVPEKTTDLEAVFHQIAEELQAQYLLGYYSPDERADGGFRAITVRAPKRPDLRVRARQGYYAPGPSPTPKP